MKKTIATAFLALVATGSLCASAALFEAFKEYPVAHEQAMKVYGSKTAAERTELLNSWQAVLGAENKPPRFILERRARKKARKAAERWARHHSISKANVFQKKAKDKARRSAERLEQECKKIEQSLTVYGRYELLHQMYLTHQVASLTEKVASLETRLAALEAAPKPAAVALTPAPTPEPAPAPTPAAETMPAAEPVVEAAPPAPEPTEQPAEMPAAEVPAEPAPAEGAPAAP